jgi:hypothetical protein
MEWRISPKHHARIHFLSAISALGEMFPLEQRPKAFLHIKDVHVYEWLDIFSLISAEVKRRAPPPPPVHALFAAEGKSSTEDDDDNEVTVI